MKLAEPGCCDVFDRSETRSDVEMTVRTAPVIAEQLAALPIAEALRDVTKLLAAFDGADDTPENRQAIAALRYQRAILAPLNRAARELETILIRHHG